MAGSNLKAEWKCPACKLEWQAQISHRSHRSSGCPKCSQANKVVQCQPTFAEAQPPELVDWNFERHDAEGIYPDNTTLGSNKMVHWICLCCLRGQPHCRRAAPYSRVGDGQGCPVCAGKQVCVCNSVESLFPLTAAEWDYESNDAEGIYPDQTTAGSHKLVHWICLCCPRGQPHRWTAPPYSRTGQGQGCAVCAGKQACLCNSLEFLFPSLAAEFDVDENGFAPPEVTAHSYKKVWWRNAKRGSWKQSVAACTDNYRRQSL